MVRYLGYDEVWHPRSGRVLVHNRLAHTPKQSQGVKGFRYWEQASSPNLEECSCGWRPEWGTHYRVKEFQRKSKRISRVASR